VIGHEGGGAPGGQEPFDEPSSSVSQSAVPLALLFIARQASQSTTLPMQAEQAAELAHVLQIPSSAPSGGDVMALGRNIGIELRLYRALCLGVVGRRRRCTHRRRPLAAERRAILHAGAEGFQLGVRTSCRALGDLVVALAAGDDAVDRITEHGAQDVS
jgi:hypothetical protein